MLHDHHFHPLAYAELVLGLELMAATSLDQVLSMVSARAQNGEGPVVGMRLNEETLSEARLPTASDIDDVVSDRPVIIYRYCGHIAVANNAALDLAGITAETVDPPGGSIDRDSGGRPTGVLRETAIDLVGPLVGSLVTPPSDDDIIEALGTLPTMGIGSVTGIVSYQQGIWGGAASELGELIRLGPRLPIAIDVLVITDNVAHLTEAKTALDRAEGPLRFLGWKEFSDGSLGGHTAALQAPFSDRQDTRGTFRLDRNFALAMGEATAGLGGAVAIHAIGDRANDEVLRLMAELASRGVDPDLLRVEHASLLSDRAIEQFANIGVTASVQPAFMPSEETWVEKRIGSDRMHQLYPFRSLIEAGVTVLGGSDAPVEHPDPEVAIAAASHRRVLNPGQAVTEPQARAMFAPPGQP